MIYFFIDSKKDLLISEQEVGVPVLIDSTSIVVDGEFSIFDNAIGDNNYVFMNVADMTYYMDVNYTDQHPVVLRFLRKQYLTEPVVILTTNFDEPENGTAIVGSGGYSDIDKDFIGLTIMGTNSNGVTKPIEGIVDQDTYGSIIVSSSNEYMQPYINTQCPVDIIRIEGGQSFLVDGVADLTIPGTYMAIIGSRSQVDTATVELNLNTWFAEIFYVI